MKIKTVIIAMAATVAAYLSFAADMASQPWVDMKMHQQTTNLQEWVVRYVAEHGGGGGTNGISQSWVRGYVSSNATNEAWVKDYVRNNGGVASGGYAAPSSNTVSGLVSMFRLAAVQSQRSMTNDAYVATSTVTNLNLLCLAPIADGIYTNAPARVYMTETDAGLDLRDGAVSYTSTNVAEFVTLTSATGGVVRLRYTKVTDRDINKAKGE